MKTDAGDVQQVQVPTTAAFKRIAPGAEGSDQGRASRLQQPSCGRSRLVTLDPNFTGATPQAARIIAIKQTDVAKKQEAENAAWNQGVHGLVKSIDVTTGVIS